MSEASRPSALAGEGRGHDLANESASNETAPNPRGRELSVPNLGEVLRAIIEVSRDTVGVASTTETAFAFISTLESLFPGRLFAIRLVGEDGTYLDYVYATGSLEKNRRNEIRLSARGLEMYGIHTASQRGAASGSGLEAMGHIATTPRYETIFCGVSSGFDIPLLDRERVLGVLSVEYAKDTEVPVEDYGLVLPIALQFGAALANKRLIEDSAHLRDKMARLIEHASTPILVLDLEGFIEVSNHAFDELIPLRGDSRERLHDFVYPSDREIFADAFRQAAEGTPSEVEIVLAKRYEPKARVLWNLAPIPALRPSPSQAPPAMTQREGPQAPELVPDAVVAVGRDMSQIRELEKRMLQAEKLATLGQLAAGIVHELNNPLTSISAYAEYLLKVGRARSAQQEDLQKLERIIESSDRIARFARDLISYAKPSPDRPQPLCVDDVIEQATVFCEHILARHEVTVERHLTTGSHEMVAVRDQLQQVFINLITNACHAMEGKVDATLSLESSFRDDCFHVYLRDNGVGIPREHVEQVFEPFFSTKTEKQGTGLGLSIVRNIIEQHGGNVRCESVLGEGSVFHLTLPASLP